MTATQDPPPETGSEDSAPASSSPPSNSTSLEVSLSSRRLTPDAAEFLLVLAFTVLPSLAMSAVGLAYPQDQRNYSPLIFLQYLPRMAEMVIPVLYIVHLRGRPMSSLGIVSLRRSDAGWGMLVFIAGWIAAVIAMYMVYIPLTAINRAEARDVATFFPHTTVWWGYLAIMASSISVGFGEELVFRGYMISQWERLSKSPVQAIVVSAILFAIVHVYQGTYGVVNAFALGLVYGGAFVMFRRLWPLAFAHALTDIIALSMRTT